MLGEQNTEPFLRFLTKNLPPLKKGEKIRTIKTDSISLKDVEDKHAIFGDYPNEKIKMGILPKYRDLYYLTETEIQEDGFGVRKYKLKETK